MDSPFCMWHQIDDVKKTAHCVDGFVNYDLTNKGLM